MEASPMPEMDHEVNSAPLESYNGETVTLLPPAAFESFVQSLDEPVEEMPLLAKISVNDSHLSILK
jgi:outer membrane lipoprotein-sorting protein